MYNERACRETVVTIIPQETKKMKRKPLEMQKASQMKESQPTPENYFQGNTIVTQGRLETRTNKLQQ